MMVRRSRELVVSLGLAAALTLASTASAQTPALSCTDVAEAVETSITAPTSTVGTLTTVRVLRKEGRVAPVSGVTVSATVGLQATPLATPEPGTFSDATFRLPDVNRIVVTFSWAQGEEPGFAAACSGQDQYEVTIGPSASQLRGFAARAARAQTLWVRHRARLRALADRLEAAVDAADTEAEVFQAVRATASRELAQMPAIRAISARYAAQVRAARPPRSLLLVNRRLALTAFKQDASTTTWLFELSRATTLADITRAGRGFESRIRLWNRARNDWRTAVVDAFRVADIAPPSWIIRVGRNTP